MKTGVFGGTFNPVHMGHLINAALIKEDFQLDRIIFIPAKYPVHKELAFGVSPSHRLEMLHLAVSGIKGFEVSALEMESPEPSYTITTMHELTSHNPSDEFYIIIGTDSYLELSVWKESRQLLDKYFFIVMDRGGTPADNLYPGAKGIFFAGNPVIGLSSSMIRQRISAGSSARYMTPQPVLDYINQKGLYKN